MPPTVLTSGFGSWGRWCRGRIWAPTPGKERGTMQHAGNHVNFKSYFQLGRAETAEWWSFPPASSREVCLQQHSSGSGERARANQSSTLSPSSHATAWRRAAAAPQPGRTSLLARFPEPPPLFSHTDFALPFCRRLCVSERCWYIQGDGY